MDARGLVVNDDILTTAERLNVLLWHRPIELRIEFKRQSNRGTNALRIQRRLLRENLVDTSRDGIVAAELNKHRYDFLFAHHRSPQLMKLISTGSIPVDATPHGEIGRAHV